MEDKMPGVVREITLNTNTYSERSIKPTLINFFFGKNGVGKTTIAQCFKGEKVGISPDISAYEPLVYDKEFIEKHLQEDKDMPGVFGMNPEDEDKQKQITAKQNEIGQAREQLNAKKQEKTAKENFPASIKPGFEGSVWNVTGNVRDTFYDAVKAKVSGRVSKVNFFDQIIKEGTAKEANLDDLRRLYEIAFGSDSAKYSALKKPQLIAEVKMDGFDLLDTEILSSSDNDYAKFIRRIGATDWLKRSHEKFAHKAGNQCPYCSRNLMSNFEEELAACFDEQYQKDVAALKSFIDTYKQKAAAVLSVFRSNKNGAFPKINFSVYDAKVAELAAIIELNKKTLQEKTDAPGSKVSVESIDDKIAEINGLIDGFNSEIKENNDIVTSRKAKQAECVTAVWQHLAFLVKGIKADYDKKIQDNKAALKKIESEIKEITDKGMALKAEIANLTKEIKGVDSTMIAINQTLSDSGFQGFRLAKKSNKDADKNRYVIIRDDGTIANKGLSEGERNFIAFLYFYHKVWGRESAEAEFKDRIVLIDDPVSSMDSNSLFIVSSLIRRLIGICYNNGSAAPRDAQRFIKQIFILTHNAYFLREISYDRLKQYQCVNFYHIKKKNNQSSIIHCVRHDIHSNTPTIEQNYNPVQNAYEALWREYNEVKSSAALKRITRQVLEYYFIQIGGYEGQSLHDRIFENDEAFNNENGDRNEELVQSINALLRYIGSDAYGFNDGMEYVDDSEDVDTIKATFEKIFEVMGQQQHFRMMMNAVKE